MPNLNRVMLMGNLTRDPELRYLPSNMPVVSIAIAINRRWKNQQGEMQKDAIFVDCDAFGRTAEVINQYLKKGKPIFIEGRLRMDEWQDKEGHPRSKMKVVIESFEFIDSREGGAPGGPGGPGAGAANQGGPARSAPRPNAGPGAGAGSSPPPPSDSQAHQPIQEEDIPF